MMKTLPKSLHTVRALVSVAQYFIANNEGATLNQALIAAAQILGFDTSRTADDHGLIAQAFTQLREKGY